MNMWRNKDLKIADMPNMGAAEAFFDDQGHKAYNSLSGLAQTWHQIAEHLLQMVAMHCMHHMVFFDCLSCLISAHALTEIWTSCAMQRINTNLINYIKYPI